MSEHLKQLPELKNKLDGRTIEANTNVTEKVTALKNKVDEIGKDT